MKTNQRIKVKTWLGIVFLLAATAMGVGTVPAAEPKQPLAAATPAFDKITYQDSGGFSGRGSGKSLLLAADGKLEVKSRTGEAKTVQLEKEELVEINNAVAAVNWTTVEKAYRSQGRDVFINSLTIVIAGTTHQTSADQLAKLPPELKTLFVQLDATYRRASGK